MIVLGNVGCPCCYRRSIHQSQHPGSFCLFLLFISLEEIVGKLRTRTYLHIRLHRLARQAMSAALIGQLLISGHIQGMPEA